VAEIGEARTAVRRVGEYEVEIIQRPGGLWVGSVIYIDDGSRQKIGETKLKNQRGEAVAEAERIAKAHKGPEIEKLDV
jgi:hypothetical protein